eukprot:4297982-Ditylum_brightwellii.AAC.1
MLSLGSASTGQTTVWELSYQERKIGVGRIMEVTMCEGRYEQGSEVGSWDSVLVEVEGTVVQVEWSVASILSQVAIFAWAQ